MNSRKNSKTQLHDSDDDDAILIESPKAVKVGTVTALPPLLLPPMELLDIDDETLNSGAQG